MDWSAIGPVLGAIGTLLATVNIVGGWLDKRRKGTVDARRADVEGLSALVEELQEDNRDLRESRASDRALIEAQRLDLASLRDEVAEMKRQSRRDQDSIDRLTLALELATKERKR